MQRGSLRRCPLNSRGRRFFAPGTANPRETFFSRIYPVAPGYIPLHPAGDVLHPAPSPQNFENGRQVHKIQMSGMDTDDEGSGSPSSSDPPSSPAPQKRRRLDQAHFLFVLFGLVVGVLWLLVCCGCLFVVVLSVCVFVLFVCLVCCLFCLVWLLVCLVVVVCLFCFVLLHCAQVKQSSVDRGRYPGEHKEHCTPNIHTHLTPSAGLCRTMALPFRTSAQVCVCCPFRCCTCPWFVVVVVVLVVLLVCPLCLACWCGRPVPSRSTRPPPRDGASVGVGT